MSESLSLWFHFVWRSNVKHFTLQNQTCWGIKQLCLRLLEMTIGKSIFVEIHKCASILQIKCGNIQNHSFLGSQEKKSNNFHNHEDKINTKNISNPRIRLKILCPNSHRLVAQLLDLHLKTWRGVRDHLWEHTFFRKFLHVWITFLFISCCLDVEC